jgi:hypothetical protein
MKKEDFSSDFLGRFDAKVDTTGGPDACHPWLGYKNEHGYGRVKLDGRLVLAHRVSFVRAGGKFRRGKPNCLHSCHNPGCTNARHLRAGSHNENMAECAAAGRSNKPKGDAHWSTKHPEKYQRGEAHYARRHPERLPRGAAHANSKLTEHQIHNIRKELEDRETQQSVAKRYGVGQAHVSRIKRGKNWAHIS